MKDGHHHNYKNPQVLPKLPGGHKTVRGFRVFTSLRPLVTAKVRCKTKIELGHKRLLT
jgi:hypothetical protein